jgi:hypothetical protein
MPSHEPLREGMCRMIQLDQIKYALGDAAEILLELGQSL